MADKDLFGFKLIKESFIKEYDSKEIILEHKATGLKVVHFLNEDPENLFAFIFRTPVTDNKGLPHIMEHSTLCGSRYFKLKDPFVFLLKGSMNTYLNAFTGQDCTVYLAGSTVQKDYFNLMTVYGDAVFFPMLNYEVFQQEGYHYKPTPEGVKIQGVVYNEMQGNYSNAEMIVNDWSSRSLFPDTTYGYDCGGDPDAIPDLTYQEFLDFHKKFYHPTNGKIFLYGNIPTATQLEFLEKNFLKDFSHEPRDTAIPPQARWSEGIHISKPYPAKTDVSLDSKSAVTVNWLTAEVSEPFVLLQLELLSEILLGNAGSPLRKALVDSRLGEDLSPASGIDAGTWYVAFSAGLRGTDPDKADGIEKVIYDTLEGIVRDGIDKDHIDAALHRIEFRKRELSSTSPSGIRLLFKALRGWIYDQDPRITIEYEKWLEKLNTLIKKEKDFYKRLIKKYLLENKHRSLVTIYPDPEKRLRDEEKVSSRLKEIETDAPRMEQLKKEAEALDLFQHTPDSPEEIAKVPVLGLSDLPRTVTSIPFETEYPGPGMELFFHNIETNGIIYIDIAINLNNTREEDCDFLPLFGKALLGSGLPGVSYDRVAGMISLYTGSLSMSLSVDTSLDEEDRRLVIISVKMLKEKFSEALNLVCSLLREADFQDRIRLKDVVVELKNKYKSSIIPHGNYYTSLRAAAMLSPVMALEERWSGIEQYLFLDRLTMNLEDNLDMITQRLESSRENLLTDNEIFINVTCRKDIYKGIRKELKKELLSLFRYSSGKVTQLTIPLFPGPVESILTSSGINFVSHAFAGARMDSPDYGVEAVLTHLLNTSFLWDEVRLKGGAYGVSGSNLGLEGIYTFSSFRDPRINNTLQAYEKSLQHIMDNGCPESELELAIIGTIGKHEKPLRGARRGYINFKREIYGVTDEIRQARRDRILALVPSDLSEYAAKMLEAFRKGSSVILSSKGAIDRAAEKNSRLPGRILELPI